MAPEPACYFRVAEGEPLPDLEPYAPYRAVVVLESECGSDWQNEVSDRLVRSGCLFMMAWGPGCSSWDDSVDWANLADFDYGDIPDERIVWTTWHERETLDEVFWFAARCASHDHAELRNTILLHVSPKDEAEEMLERFRTAQDRR
jgi:hypothetical protein